MSWCGGGEIRPTPGVECRVPGDPRVDLVSRQLAALARLGPLRHLDLQVVGVDEVLAGHPEPAARHLLDGRPPEVAVGVGEEPVGVLAALAGVGPRAQPVHRDREGLVRLGRDRAVGHGPGGEPLHDRRDRFNFIKSNFSNGPRFRLALVDPLDPEQAAERGQLRRLVVDQGGVLLEDLVAAAPGRVLELEDGLRVEQVRLALAPPLILAAGLQLPVGEAGAAMADGGAARRLLRENIESDAAEPG